MIADLLVFGAKLGNLELEPDVLLLQQLSPDGDLLLLGPASIPRSLGSLVVLPPTLPIGSVAGGDGVPAQATEGWNW